MQNIIQIEPWIDEEEKYQLLRVIENTYVTENQLTLEFEEKIKQLTNSKYAIAVTNGTVALYSCLLALGIGPGDEVIVPNLTFIATSNAVIWAGATPIFCDVDETCCIDPIKIRQLITQKTKAIIPVHLYGNSADVYEIRKICDEFKLYMLEDAAQGVGVFQDGKHAGTFGNCGVLSFYGNKTITCGEGGIILTDDENIAKKCYKLKNHGREKKGIFIHESIGYNFSFTEMQAAIGIAQLNKLSRIKAKKKKIHETYENAFKNLPNLTSQKFRKGCEPVHWFTSFFTSKKSSLQDYLRKECIQTRDFFLPLHQQPCYSHLASSKEVFQTSIELYSTGISLPSSYNLPEDQQEYVIQKIREFYER